MLEIPALSIRCIFIGPDCPKKNASNEVKVSMPDLKWYELVMETHRCNYCDSETKEKQLGMPGAIVFFNPGFNFVLVMIGPRLLLPLHLHLLHQAVLHF